MLLLPSWGCYEHTVTVGAGAPRAPVVLDQWENFWLGGLIGHVKVDVERMCPSGNATVEAKQTFLNGLVTALTSGIYSPTTLRVRCENGRRADVDLDAADVATLVTDASFARWVRAVEPGRYAEVLAAQRTLAER
jgi:hypothetical protein